MHVWNLLHAARWKYRTQKGRQQSPSGHHRTTLSGYIFATKPLIDNRKKLVNQQYLLQMSLQYGELRLINGWDRLAGLGHPILFQRVSRLGSVTARQSSSGRHPNFAALNRGRHLCSAGRPSRWALAHILVVYVLFCGWLYIACICSIVAWWGGPDGTEAWSLGPLLPSVRWHCWLGHLTLKTRPLYDL